MFRFVSSIRFQVWMLFIGFTAAMLVFLYINQVVLLPNFYDFIKTQEARATANYLKNQWGKESLYDYLYELAFDQEMGIVLWEFGTGSDGRDTVYTINPYDMVLLSSIQSAQLYQLALEAKTGVYTQKIARDENSRALLVLSTYVGSKHDPQGYIVILNYVEPLTNTRDIIENQFFLNASVLLCSAFILSAFVVIRISNPIIRISRHAMKLPKGEFKMEAVSGDYAEIKLLKNNLNKASGEISKTENLRKDLLANVSHDMKTPLTMIKAYAEMIRDLSGDNPEKRARHLSIIIEEADRLNGLVVDMLDLSKIQSGVAETAITSFDLSEHLGAVLKRFDYLESSKMLDLKTEITPGIIVKADIPKLEQVIYNLVTNAINYTGDDGLVTVKLARKTKTIARFEVTDTGKGIAKEELAYIWERYYKAEKSEFHQRTAVGTGIGLSIVKGVLELHGFAYGVSSTVGKGSTFWFECPCAAGEEAI